ncbi:hypothetical protein BDV24DRAFT_107387 [Aspergillus arachidicola]|uniref:Uncharacterized protein n=1 Tax=Aspergillus arachidicola TaxID=656916 RepID=A0A5N6XWR5_9EURO|nr:hypothetical protein BDV24DRAFT_107387 [Aspergillus arachidicola]
MPAGPMSPVSFPLFCSPQELISDNQREHTRDDGLDACYSRFPGDLPPISLRITPQPTDPLAQHCPLEPVKHLAVPNVRRASVSSNPPGNNLSCLHIEIRSRVMPHVGTLVLYLPTIQAAPWISQYRSMATQNTRRAKRHSISAPKKATLMCFGFCWIMAQSSMQLISQAARPSTTRQQKGILTLCLCSLSKAPTRN